MNCPECNFENDSDAAFCENCGVKLTRACANCGATLKPNAKFCKQCGTPVNAQPQHSAPAQNTAPASSSAQRLVEIQRAAPRALQEKIRAARPAMQGERKTVTILFTDIVGSTTLAEGLDPEDWKEIVQQAHQHVSDAVYRYEGYIAQLLGDGVLAFFGAPVTHEDDPVRAVHAALDIQSAIHAFSEQLNQRGRVKNFRMRVGLNTGLVVLEQIGSDRHTEYLAVGDPVNLAARLQSAAEPGHVLISEFTYKSVAHQFECTDLGTLTVKGKTEPVRVYQVERVKTERGSARGITGLTSAMVGRDAQLASLCEHSRAVVTENAGRIALIIGEPGLGKSRLLSEWQNADARAQIETWQSATGQCVSYGQTLVYHLILSLTQSLLGIGSSASDAQLERALYELVPDEAREIFPYVAQLFGITTDASNQARASLDAQSLHAQYIASLRRIILARAARGPLKLICEDVHWSDPSSVEILSTLLPLTLQARILYVFVTRPDRDASGWKLVENARARFAPRTLEIALAPISESDSQQLVANLLHVESLPAQVRDLILIKSEGNPFFIEEVIRLLIDQNAIVLQDGRWLATREIANVQVPDSLQRLLLARIDRLVNELKQTVRVASVIGREFSESVLEFVLTNARTESERMALQQDLDALQDKGLIEALRKKREPAYLFRHALVQEAAYEAILKNDRRTLHRIVGQAIETLFAENAQELAATLAFHFSRAEDWDQALAWAGTAAERAAAQWALQEAVAQYNAALAALAHLAPAPAREFALRFELARTMMFLGLERDTVRAEFERALSFAPDARAQARVNLELGKLFHIYTGSDLSLAEKFYETALTLAGETRDEFFGTTLAFLGYLYRYQARIPLSVETLERALTLAQDIHSARLQADANIFLSGAYLDAERTEDALRASLRGLALANEIGNLELMGRAHSFCTDLYLEYAQLGKGSPDDALPHIQEMLRHGREYGTGVLSGFGYLDLAQYFELVGRIDEALCAWQDSARVWEVLGAPLRAVYAYGKAAQLFLTRGARSDAEALFERIRHLSGPDLGRADLYIGLAYAGAGYGDDAVLYLRRAFDAPGFAAQRAAWIAHIRTKSEFEKQRALPQVQQLLALYDPIA